MQVGRRPGQGRPLWPWVLLGPALVRLQSQSPRSQSRSPIEDILELVLVELLMKTKMIDRSVPVVLASTQTQDGPELISKVPHCVFGNCTVTYT